MAYRLWHIRLTFFQSLLISALVTWPDSQVTIVRGRHSIWIVVIWSQRNNFSWPNPNPSPDPCPVMATSCSSTWFTSNCNRIIYQAEASPSPSQLQVATKTNPVCGCPPRRLPRPESGPGPGSEGHCSGCPFPLNGTTVLVKSSGIKSITLTNEQLTSKCTERGPKGWLVAYETEGAGSVEGERVSKRPKSAVWSVLGLTRLVHTMED